MKMVGGAQLPGGDFPHVTPSHDLEVNFFNSEFCKAKGLFPAVGRWRRRAKIKDGPSMPSMRARNVSDWSYTSV